MTDSHTKTIARLLRRTKSEAELASLLEDILSPSEREKIVERVRIVSMLIKKRPQREVASSLGVGIATVTRGASLFRKKDGVLARLLESEK